ERGHVLSFDLPGARLNRLIIDQVFQRRHPSVGPLRLVASRRRSPEVPLEELMDVAGQVVAADPSSLKEGSFLVGLKFDVDGHGRSKLREDSSSLAYRKRPDLG